MNTIKQNIKKVARPIYHKVVPEKIRTRRAARLNRSLEYETWISNKSLIPERIRLTNSRIKKIRPNSKEDF